MGFSGVKVICGRWEACRVRRRLGWNLLRAVSCDGRSAALASMNILLASERVF